MNYAKKLLSLEIRGVDDYNKIMGVILPWATDSDSDAEQFNLISAKLHALSCFVGGKIEVLEKILIESVVVEVIMTGKPGFEKALSLIEALLDALPGARTAAKMPNAYTSAVENISAIAAAIKVIFDPSPLAVTQSNVGMRLVRALVFGGSLHPPWSLVSEAMEESDAWPPLKRQFRTSVATDLTVGREMQRAIQDLDEKSLRSLTVAVEKLPGWIARSRPGGAQSFQDALVAVVEHLAAQLNDLSGEERLIQARARARALGDEVIKMSAVGVNLPPMLRPRFQEVRKKVRQVCGDSNRNMIEETFLVALKSFGHQPTEESFGLVLESADSVFGIRFNTEAHMIILNVALEACVAFFADPALHGGRSGSKAAEDLEAARSIVKNLEGDVGYLRLHRHPRRPPALVDVALAHIEGVVVRRRHELGHGGLASPARCQR